MRSIIFVILLAVFWTFPAVIASFLGKIIYYLVILFNPEISNIFLFPCIIIPSVMVIAAKEIFQTARTVYYYYETDYNPYILVKSRFLIARSILLTSLIIGVGIGLSVGVIYKIILLVDICSLMKVGRPTCMNFYGFIGWLFLGVAVGLTEGLIWRWRVIEAGYPKTYLQRLRRSIIAGVFAGTLVGILGQSLGSLSGILVFTMVFYLILFLSPSPAFLPALKAGGGFEFREGKNARKIPATIDTDLLKFVSEDRSEEEIEEGLSIQLPTCGSVIVGSDQHPRAHIRLPNAPMHLANIELRGRYVILKPDPKFFRHISIDHERLSSKRCLLLGYNNVLRFYTENSQDEESIDNEQNSSTPEFYEFAYYNRFIDPEG